MDPETESHLDSIVDRRLIVAFDLYGTLLSTSSISKALKEHFPEQADSIATTWRKYQLEYTWRLNSMDSYEPFDSVTRKSLLHALSENSLSLSSSEIDSILKSYGSLSTFPDVSTLLSLLTSTKFKKSIKPTIFSNGTLEMIKTSISSTSELDIFKNQRDSYVSVNDIEKYKPHPMVYEYLIAKLGRSFERGKVGGVDEILLVTANEFDIVGAEKIGIRGIWLDRGGNGWKDQLLEKPSFVIESLEGLEGVFDEVLGVLSKRWDEKEGKD